MEDEPSARLVDQRARNRIMEAVAILADGDAGVRDVGPKEYFHIFYDWIFDLDHYNLHSNTAITTHEARALRDLCALLNKACDATPPIMSRPEELIATGWPERIRPLAEKTLLLMRRRGSFREEAEESEPGVKAAHGE